MTGKGKTGSFSLSLSESAWEVLRMLRVVLADDENKVILLMQKLIDWEALGYEIAGTANDGLRALELVREKQPHLLITDVRMPGCDGIELIQRAKALQPKLHFIVITGLDGTPDGYEAIKDGRITGTVAQDGGLMASSGVEAAVTLLDGGTLENNLIIADSVWIDSSNVADYE